LGFSCSHYLSKLLAAGAPYVALAHMTEFFMALAVMSLAAVATHRILGKIPQFRKHVEDWVSWNNKGHFPFGVPIAATLSLYLFSSAFFS